MQLFICINSTHNIANQSFHYAVRIMLSTFDLKLVIQLLNLSLMAATLSSNLSGTENEAKESTLKPLSVFLKYIL